MSERSQSGVLPSEANDERLVQIKSWMTSEVRNVPLSEVKRFGKMDRYGDNRSWTICELIDGSVWYSLYRDQTADVIRVMRKRLVGVRATAFSYRAMPEVHTWEPPSRPTMLGDLLP